MANDLTSQLTLNALAGSAGTVDPAMAAAIPRLQLAQAMMQEGMNGAPTTAWGALGRLGQAIVGNMLYNRASEGLTGAMSGAGPQTADALDKSVFSTGQPHPLSALLRSNNPMLVQMGLKAAPAAFTALGGVGEQRPGVSATVGINSTNNPAGGYTAPAQTTADIRAGRIDAPAVGTMQSTIDTHAAPGAAVKAGAIANAEVPAKNAVETHRGTVQIAVDRAHPQKLNQGETLINPAPVIVPGSGGGGAPRAEPPPVSPPPPQNPPPVAGGAAVPQSGASGPSVAPQVPQQATDTPSGMTAPKGVEGGLGNAVTMSMVPQAKARMWDADHATAVKAQEDLQKEVTAGQPVLQTNAAIRAIKPGVTTGPMGDLRDMASQWLTGLGMSPDNAQKLVGTNPVDSTLFQKLAMQAVTGQIKGLGREPGYIFDKIQNANPNLKAADLSIDPLTRLMDAAQYYKQDKLAAGYAWNRDSVNQLSDEKGYRGRDGFEADFAKTNNPIIYGAAALAAGKMPFSVWSHGLSDVDKTAALKLAGRMWGDSGAYLPGPQGQPDIWHPMGPAR